MTPELFASHGASKVHLELHWSEKFQGCWFVNGVHFEELQSVRMSSYCFWKPRQHLCFLDIGQKKSLSDQKIAPAGTKYFNTDLLSFATCLLLEIDIWFLIPMSPKIGTLFKFNALPLEYFNGWQIVIVSTGQGGICKDICIWCLKIKLLMIKVHAIPKSVHWVLHYRTNNREWLEKQEMAFQMSETCHCIFHSTLTHSIRLFFVHSDVFRLCLRALPPFHDRQGIEIKRSGSEWKHLCNMLYFSSAQILKHSPSYIVRAQLHGLKSLMRLQTC